MRKSLFIILYLFASFIILAEKSEKFENNNSANPDGIDLFSSSITYTQEEKEKRFIAKMKIPLNDTISLNVGIETSEISDNIGSVGFISLSKKDDTHLSSGAKFDLGLTWSNYNSKIKKKLTSINQNGLGKIFEETLTESQRSDLYERKFSPMEDMHHAILNTLKSKH